MMSLPFDNRFIRSLPGDTSVEPGPRQVIGAVWSPVAPTPVATPRLLGWSREMAQTLGFTDAEVQSQAFADVFAGNALLPGMQPYAGNYGGHQFGHWAGQLGDGRAISLGETINAAGERWELQLKGAGPTPYSRTADGRAVLRSSLREFICSEAMHHLGVPTTRALSLVATGESVVRDMLYDGHPRREPGAVVCRVAPSFIRFGHFELPYARGDHALLRQLADVTIERDFPMLSGHGETRDGDWFAEVCRRTAVMIAHWMRVGFVHGVMNTDNMSILGLTIDYGPYGWIDHYDPDWTPNTTDAAGRRYRFGWQSRIAHWNLVRLAQALSPLFGDAQPLQAGLDLYSSTFEAAERDHHARKLGLPALRDDDAARVAALQALLHDGEIDMTLFFRQLAEVDAQAPSVAPLRSAFYDDALRQRIEPVLRDWLEWLAARWRDSDANANANAGGAAAQRRARMLAANPRYVPRNYLAQQAIDRAEAGDTDGIAELLEVMRQPYVDQPGRDAFAERRPDWARTRVGCSMLSCSS